MVHRDDSESGLYVGDDALDLLQHELKPIHDGVSVLEADEALGVTRYANVGFFLADERGTLYSGDFGAILRYDRLGQNEHLQPLRYEAEETTVSHECLIEMEIAQRCNDRHDHYPVLVRAINVSEQGKGMSLPNSELGGQAFRSCPIKRLMIPEE